MLHLTLVQLGHLIQKKPLTSALKWTSNKVAYKIIVIEIKSPQLRAFSLVVCQDQSAFLTCPSFAMLIEYLGISMTKSLLSTMA